MFDRVFGKRIGFKENSITQFALLTLRGDFAMLLLLLLSISTLSFSQIKINTVREGYYKIFNVDSIQIDQKATELEAMQGLTNYQLRSGKIGYYTPPNFRVDITGNIVEQIKIDTLTISGGWHMRGVNGNFYRYPDCGDIIKIEADTTISWQTDIELIRTQIFGSTNYKDTGRVPFQFVCDTITRTPGATTYRWQTFATEKHCIKTFVDGIYTGDADTSCDPGSIDYYGINLRRHTNSLKNLQPNTTYKILVEGTTEDGNFNIIEFTITTLSIEAPAEMSGLKVE